MWASGEPSRCGCLPQEAEVQPPSQIVQRPAQRVVIESLDDDAGELDESNA